MMSVFGPRFGQICRQGNNGGQSPGEQNSYQTQNTTSTSAPSPEIQPWLKNLTDKLGGYLNQHQSAPSLYGESFTAPMSDATRSGIAALTNFGNSGSSPLYASGTQLATDTMNGKFLDIGNNPYFQKSIAAGLVPLTQNLNENILPGIDSKFVGAGRTSYGGETNAGAGGPGGHYDANMRAVRDFNQAAADAAAKASLGAYQGERSNQLQTQSMLPSFQGMDLARAGALGNAGNMWDTYNQKLRDEAVYRDTYSKTGDLDYWSSLASRFGGAYPGGTTTGTGTSSGYTRFMQPSNPTSSMLGGLMGLGSLGLQAYSAFSDERLKKDIKPVGKLHDGQTIYSYKFRGSPRTEIGLLAQEVEQRHPEAVHVDPATGLKKVHYGMATAPAGGLF